eukprot:2743239-Prymnesium_polylepis.1
MFARPCMASTARAARSRRARGVDLRISEVLSGRPSCAPHGFGTLSFRLVFSAYPILAYLRRQRAKPVRKVNNFVNTHPVSVQRFHADMVGTQGPPVP